MGLFAFCPHLPSRGQYVFSRERGKHIKGLPSDLRLSRRMRTLVHFCVYVPWRAAPPPVHPGTVVIASALARGQTTLATVLAEIIDRYA